ncbi:MAG: hypothetical protein MR717_12860 [Prevotella sp.]|nr:hypothetical protein [Prevotella sp.]
MDIREYGSADSDYLGGTYTKQWLWCRGSIPQVFIAAYMSVAFVGWTLLMAFGVGFTDAHRQT